MNKLISFSDASELVFAKGKLRSNAFCHVSETIPLFAATERICAEDIFGHEAVPQFNNSSMDGFAVRAEETVRASLTRPLVFKVLGRILAGDPPLTQPSLSPLSCYEIMTGAPIPEGFDAVYKIEDVQVIRSQDKPEEIPDEIRVTAPIERHTHFRSIGEDFPESGKLFSGGTVLHPEHLMALASVGVTEVQVLRKPKVAFLSTGSELVEPSSVQVPLGKIRNSTTTYLLSALPFFGAEVKSYGTVNDDRSLFAQTLRQILKDQPDIIITTGAVSKGSHDFIPAVIKELGAETLFHHAAIRPGKPQFFAQFGSEGPAFFGIPGNPISTAIGLRFFVAPFLRALLGQLAEKPLHAIVTEDVEKPPGLRCFFKAHAELTPIQAKITSLQGQPSFMVSSLLQANAWLVLPEETELIEKGMTVEFFPLFPWAYNYAGPAETVGQGSGAECC